MLSSRSPPGATVNGPIVVDGLSSLIVNNNGQVNGNITSTNNGDFLLDQNGTSGGTTVSVTGSASTLLPVRAGLPLTHTARPAEQKVLESYDVRNTTQPKQK